MLTIKMTRLRAGR